MGEEKKEEKVLYPKWQDLKQDHKDLKKEKKLNIKGQNQLLNKSLSHLEFILHGEKVKFSLRFFALMDQRFSTILRPKV